MDARHFVIIEYRHLAKGFALTCGCIGLMLFRNISCLCTIICYINNLGIVPVYACTLCDALVASCATIILLQKNLLYIGDQGFGPTFLSL